MADSKFIFCLETEWSEKLTDRINVLSLLEFLRDSPKKIPFIHRRCATSDELRYYLHQLKKYKKYSICYFAFHGSSGSIDSENNSLSLSELTEIAGSSLKNRIVHFGSCKTLKVKDEELQNFIELTGAQMVSGYTKNIGFVESAAMDMLYFNKLQDYERLKSMENRIFEDYAGLVDSLGFKIFHR